MQKFKSAPRNTMLVIAVGFLLISFVTASPNLLFISILASTIGLISIKLSSWVEVYWFKLAHVLSYILPSILLSGIFFLILTPLAFLRRIFQDKDLMQLKNNKSSLFEEVDKSYSKIDFEKPW